MVKNIRKNDQVCLYVFDLEHLNLSFYSRKKIVFGINIQ